MRFASWVFLIATAYGIPLVGSLYFLEDRLGRDYPPEITHPEYYYGFVWVVLACQFLYLMIGLEPARYRPLMLLAAAAKAGFFITCVVLHLQGRLAVEMVATAAPDMAFAILFVVAWARMPRGSLTRSASGGSS